MEIETVEQFLKRGGKIEKVDFTRSYKLHNSYRGEFIDYTAKSKKKRTTELDKQKIRDANSYRDVI